SLREIGVHISIDDFGKKYSSLGLLRSIPISYLKIDKLFVQGIPYDQGNTTIVKAIIQVAHDLGFKVAAEGVETDEQRACLRELACDELQGYLLSHPLPEEEFGKLLESVNA